MLERRRTLERSVHYARQSPLRVSGCVKLASSFLFGRTAAEQETSLHEERRLVGGTADGGTSSSCPG